MAADYRAAAAGGLLPLVSSRPDALLEDWQDLAQVSAHGEPPALWLDAEDSPRLAEALAAGEFVIQEERRYGRVWLALSARPPQEALGD
jgi:hypothetical protein